MDYKEKYEQALAKAKDMLNYKEVRREDMEYLFPELKESEDERIRNEIIEYLKGERDAFPRESDDFQRWIAWLEKQGEQKPQRMVSAEAKEALYDKPAWSDEDEAHINGIIDYLLDYKLLVYEEDMNVANGVQKELDWLKSLSPQSQWRPSDEQMVALKHAFNDGSIDFADMKILATLYEQLKALHRYEQDT